MLATVRSQARNATVILLLIELLLVGSLALTVASHTVFHTSTVMVSSSILAGVWITVGHVVMSRVVASTVRTFENQVAAADLQVIELAEKARDWIDALERRLVRLITIFLLAPSLIMGLMMLLVSLIDLFD